MNNKDKVFIKIKGLYTGTMDEEASCDGEEVEVIESQDDEVEVINVGTYSVVNGKNIYGMRQYMMIHRNGQAA